MCGIVGVVGTPEAAQEAYQALLLLQHRGQDSAGILSVDSLTGKFHLHRELGQVSQAFDAKDLKRLDGDSAIGHTRYSTIGDIKESDLQPMAISMPLGMGMVHNGNISNYTEIRKKLLQKNKLFMSDNDLEVVLQLLSESIPKEEGSTLKKLSASVKSMMDVIEGGYSVIGLLGSEGLFAFRDPHGIRPLVLGQRKDDADKTVYCVTSETCALKFLGYEVVRDLKPGELIWIEKTEQDYHLSSVMIQPKSPKPCMFEWIYFSSADSTIENKNVYQVRLKLGTLLGERIQKDHPNLNIDVIAPVPDTSRPAAIALAEALGKPFREVLIKNRYVQRSFILNGQDRRRLAVGMKFSVVDELIRGKNVLLVDDSVVRGTTSRKLIELLKAHGAKEVYFASTCPPITNPCYYGIDFPTHGELIANQGEPNSVAKTLGANGMFYSTLEDLTQALENSEYCGACLTGEYAYPVPKITGGAA